MRANRHRPPDIVAHCGECDHQMMRSAGGMDAYMECDNPKCPQRGDRWTLRGRVREPEPKKVA